MRFTTLTEWLAWLETLHPKWIDLGLERVRAVADALALLPLNCPVITVTGTNGKGSCVALLEAILSAAGYRVGSYTSPHLLHFTERLRLNQAVLSDAVWCQEFHQVDVARGSLSLTYFEFTTLAALLIIKNSGLDIALLEVGLGGRLDAVNIVDADIAIISSIALDHMEWLGADRSAIGFEKAGIFRPGKPAVCGDFAVPDTVRDYAAQLGAPLYCQGVDFSYQDNGSEWAWASSSLCRLGQAQRRPNVGVELRDLPRPKVKLQNAATVLQAISLLPSQFDVSEEAIRSGLEKVSVLGRFQVINTDPRCIVDVAHNPEAAAYLAQQLEQLSVTGKVLAVFGMLTDKDIVATVKPLVSLIHAWHVGSLGGVRGGTAAQLAEALEIAGAQAIHCYSGIALAYQQAISQAQSNDTIIVFGSFHTVAEVLTGRLGQA